MKKILLFTICLLLVNIITASPIIVTSNNLDINLTKGIDREISVNITNPNNYTLYDLKIEGDYITTSTTIPVISFNQTKEVLFTLKVTEKGSFTKTMNILTFTRMNCSSMGQQTHDINITTLGTYPRNRDICRNDNIKYNNEYGSSIFVDIDEYSIHQGVSNGSSYSHTFSDNGMFIYKIEPLIELGYITVTDTTTNIHNSGDDGSFTLNINSNLEPTTIEVIISKTFFNTTFDGLESGYLIIKNTGDKLAEQVNLVGDWFSFDINNFDIAAGDEKAVNFVLAPIIESTSDTGKLYNKTLYINGDNFDSITHNVSVFLQYSDIAAGNISSPEWWIKRKSFCDAYPSSPDCLTEPYIVYRDKVIYDAPPILTNMSPQDVKKYIDEVYGLREDWLQYSNNFKVDNDLIKNTISEIKTIADNSLTSNKDNGKDLKEFKNIYYILQGTIIFAIAGTVAGFFLYKYYKDRQFVLGNPI